MRLGDTSPTFQYHDRMRLGVVLKERFEVRRAGGEDQLVGLQTLTLTGQCHVHQRFCKKWVEKGQIAGLQSLDLERTK